MLELRAILTCDRCHKTIVEMENIESEDEAQQRLAECGDGFCVSENGDDVCAACWAKWDEKQRSASSATKVDAVDPHVGVSTE